MFLTRAKVTSDCLFLIQPLPPKKMKNFLLILFVIFFANNAFAKPINTLQISVKPKEIYGNKKNIKIRIGNGGAGPTGILQALAEDFLEIGEKKYAIAWYQDISINTLQQLKNGKIDIALVYEKNQGDQAIKEGWAKNYTPVFNDHFLIVGAKENPAKIEKSDSLENIFLKVARLGDKNSAKTFLSRDDNSGTNVKEQSIWQSVGLAPWKENSAWYFKYSVFPRDALLYANENELYTITDWGTWLANEENITNLQIYKSGGKILLNPCFALTGQKPSDETLEFLEFLKSERAQNLIANFGKEKFGKPLFTKASQADF